jgi:hypothetical protein
MKKYFLIALPILLLSSCKDVIQVDLKKGETLLVVDAFINNYNSTQTVRLTTTADYFSNAHTPPAVGAAVSLTDLTNNKTYAFTGDGNGNYLYTPLPGDSMAQVGHNYQLNVTYNSVNYMALSKLNRTTTIDTILFKRKKSGTEDTNATPKKYFPYLIARDAPGATDYYWIKTYRNGVFYNGPGQLNVVQDAGGTGTDGLFFIPPNAFFVLTSDSEAPEYLDNCTIEIYSINAETYDFFLQLETQMSNSQAGLFATAPENVRTNIKNASGYGMKSIGWFNMGAITSKSAIAR